ncbi:MAG: RNA methyltransferase [Sphingomonas sp. SCN 67-18]|uniref:class I SAM-dependent RNA methyltransferase n=1 Tax=uncultured Sphingomonas sp. TaxID=158754 RepID=UPI00086A1DFD|nr:class I SAM-dependent RNA methyltransferase [Sphingomonas sp. SCN 67-18]ODU22150.1 MAG: RNA methyltransferase [Sphingomonas sp. SCN 67-18]
MTDQIIRVAARGEGVTADGRHVALAAPGDRLAADGAVIAGPHHAQPPCRHFPACGGCTLQHLDDAAYADFVRDRIAGALAAQGVDAPLFAPVHISPPRSRRRASLKAERKGNRVLIGFNEGRSHQIVDMAECAILDPRLFALVDPLRGLLRRLLRDRRAAGIRMTLADQGVDLMLDKVSADDLAGSEALTDFARRHALARLSIDDGYGAQTRWEPDPVTISLGGTAIPLPHDAFLQATADGEAALVAAVRDAVGGAPIVADLFAGLGTFALSLAPARRVYAGEAARDAVLALKGGAARAGLAVAVEHRDLYRRPLTTAELDRFDAAVLDPPRAGAAEQAAQIAAAKTPVVAYVSCNPSSFARDAKTMIEGGYRLDHIVPVGQFRWSTHVELCATFRR